MVLACTYRMLERCIAPHNKEKDVQTSPEVIRQLKSQAKTNKQKKKKL